MRTEVSDKTIIITGVNGGIGGACAKFALESGGKVIGLVQNKEKLTEFTKSYCKNHEANFQLVELDLCDSDSISNAAREVVSLSGGEVHGLINCAGIASGARFGNVRMSDVENDFQVNFFGPMKFTQFITRRMTQKKQGSVVNIVSLSGEIARPGNFSYGSSKAALAFATKVLAIELGVYGVRVNAISPGLIETSMLDQMDNAQVAEIVENTALGRIGEPKEVAALAMYLVSDSSSFITGQVIRVDGGQK